MQIAQPVLRRNNKNNPYLLKTMIMEDPTLNKKKV